MDAHDAHRRVNQHQRERIIGSVLTEEYTNKRYILV